MIFIGEPRFDAKVAEGEPFKDLGPCWIWQAGRQGGGYGAYSQKVEGPPNHRHRQRVAHRYAYEQMVGPVPPGLELDHLCRVRHCVNPAHLEPVTHLENLMRGLSPSTTAEMNAARAAARTHCRNGHAFDEKNTGRDPRGHRVCRACNKVARDKWKAKKRAAVA